MAKSKKSRSQRDEILYHVGQMAFIGALIVVLWAVVAVAKAQGF
jgi:hypothetical protein